MITNLGHFQVYKPAEPPVADALYFKNQDDADFYELQETIEGACFLLAEPGTNKIVDHSLDVSTLAPFDHLLLASDEALALDETQDWVFTGEAIAVKQPTLETVKQARISELTGAFNAALNAGFSSEALGTAHRYDSELHNRENLIGAVATGVSQMFTCDDGQGEATSKAQRRHSPEQLRAVLIDGAAVKQALIARLRAKRAEVLTATTEAEVSAVTWGED